METTLIQEFFYCGTPAILGAIIATFAFTKFFEVRHVVLFWTLRMILAAALSALIDPLLYAMDFSKDMVWITTILLIFIYEFLLPLAFCKGKMLQLLFVTLFMALVMETPVLDMFFSLFIGEPLESEWALSVLQSWSHPIAYVVSALLGAAACSGIIYLLYRFLNRRTGQIDAEPASQPETE